MKRRWIARLLTLALALALLTPAMGAALAEATASTPLKVTLKMGVKQTFQINSASIPGASGQTLAYKSKDKKIASVSSSGVITAKKKGKTKIYVGYGKTVLAECTVKVLNQPKKVTLSDKAAVLGVGETKQLKATLPKNTYSPLTFKSADESVVTVDDTGKLTGVATGKTTVTVTLYNNKSAKCEVAVLSGNAPTKLTLNTSGLSLAVGETFKLSPSVDEGASAVYSFSSKDKKIASVSSDGVVTAKKKGSTKITVKTHNGLKQTITVKVTKKLSLTEVYGLLTNSQETFLANATKLNLKKDTDDPDSTTVMYYDSQLGYIAKTNSCSVTLNPATTPKYSIEGIHTGMSPQQAAAKLVEGGWAQSAQTTVDGTEIRSFTKGGDNTHTISIATQDGTSILGIDAELTW